MTDAEKDWASARMVRNMYQDVDTVHAHTIIALCLMLDKYLQPKLECQKKMHHSTKPLEWGPGSIHADGTSVDQGQEQTPEDPQHFQCWAGPDLV